MNEAVANWMAYAHEDLRAIPLMIGDDLFGVACFHAQQCIEKSLKAALILSGQKVIQTHSIGRLLDMLPMNWFGEIGERVSEVDAFYIPVRYPDALPGMLPDRMPERDDAERAYETARMVYERVVQLAEGG